MNLRSINDLVVSGKQYLLFRDNDDNNDGGNNMFDLWQFMACTVDYPIKFDTFSNT